jgi:hypothetical protein
MEGAGPPEDFNDPAPRRQRRSLQRRCRRSPCRGRHHSTANQNQGASDAVNLEARQEVAQCWHVRELIRARLCVPTASARFERPQMAICPGPTSEPVDGLNALARRRCRSAQRFGASNYPTWNFGAPERQVITICRIAGIGLIRTVVLGRGLSGRSDMRRIISASLLILASAATASAQGLSPSVWQSQRGGVLKVLSVDPAGNFTGVFISSPTGPCPGVPHNLVGRVRGSLVVFQTSRNWTSDCNVTTNWTGRFVSPTSVVARGIAILAGRRVRGTEVFQRI